MLGVAALGHAGSIQVEWMETARFHDGTTALMQERPPLKLEPMEHLPTAHALTIDRSRSYQEILGFGGAFTEAAAINWRLLSQADQDRVIDLYFGAPEAGGHGYTLGRKPRGARTLD